MKIIITGSAGFIGRHLINSLHDFSIICNDINGKPDNIKLNSKSCWVSGSFTCEKTLNQLVKEISNDESILIHLATTQFPQEAESNILKDVRDNLYSSVMLFEAFFSAGGSKVIFASSSGALYCNQDIESIEGNESPESCYGISKLSAEMYLKKIAAKYKKQVISLRISNLYGDPSKNSKEYGVIPTFIRKIKNKEPVILYDKNIEKDFIHIVDLVAAIELSISYTGPYCEFNISSGSGTKLEELVEIIEEKLNTESKVIYQKAEYPKMTVGAICNSRAREELEWTPKKLLGEIIINNKK